VFLGELLGCVGKGLDGGEGADAVGRSAGVVAVEAELQSLGVVNEGRAAVDEAGMELLVRVCDAAEDRDGGCAAGGGQAGPRGGGSDGRRPLGDGGQGRRIELAG